MIPERLFRILRSCESNDASHFPATEVFNEGWMLRLILDAVQTLSITDHPLHFLNGAKWYSEALLSSPFRPRSKQDSLGEGFTNADAVIGHFDFRASTRSGLTLPSYARQFIVVEAKMFSNLSSGTKNALGYNQAARNVACMAAAIAQIGRAPADLGSIGFFVLAPALDRRRHHDTNLEASLDPNSIRSAVRQRITAYEAQSRPEAAELRVWEAKSFLPLVEHLAFVQRLAVLSWETCIESIRIAHPAAGDELHQFYERCLTFAPPHTVPGR
jgi:hypothetical protein